MKLKEKLIENNKKMYNYPIKSGMLVGDLLILSESLLLLGISIGIYMHSDLPFKEIMIGFMFVFTIVAVINLYKYSYKILRKYEDEHGSTKVGDKKYE